MSEDDGRVPVVRFARRLRLAARLPLRVHSARLHLPADIGANVSEPDVSASQLKEGRVRSRFVVEPGFCSWHVWERIAPRTKQRVATFNIRQEARELARQLNRRDALDKLTAETQRLGLY